MTIKNETIIILEYRCANIEKTYGAPHEVSYYQEFQTEDQAFAWMHFVDTFGERVLDSKQNITKYIHQGKVPSELWNNVKAHLAYPGKYLDKSHNLAINTETYKMYRKSIAFVPIADGRGLLNRTKQIASEGWPTFVAAPFDDTLLTGVAEEINYEKWAEESPVIEDDDILWNNSGQGAHDKNPNKRISDEDARIADYYEFDDDQEDD